MAFPGTGKIWMNGSLVDWNGREDPRRVPRRALRQRRLRRRAVLRHGQRPGLLPARRAHAAAARLGPHLPDGVALRPADADRRGHRSDPGQRVPRLLHPPADLPRLRLARRQPDAVPGGRRHHAVGMGRLLHEGSDRGRPRRQDLDLGADRAEHDARRWPRAWPTTPTRSSSRWRRWSTATPKASRSTPRATSAKAAARTSSSSATASSTRRRSATPCCRGITRDSVITIARDLGFEVREQTLPRETLYIADEVFFVGTAVEVTPIRSVDRDQGRPRPPRADHRGHPAAVLPDRPGRGAGHARLAAAGAGAGGHCTVPR